VKRFAMMVLLAVVGCGESSTEPIVGRPTANGALALGSRFSCALNDAARLYCWGDGLAGQIGDSAFLERFSPTAARGVRDYRAVAAGDRTGCALDTTGMAWCWGDDPARVTLFPTLRSTPTAVTAPRPFASITVGRNFACALTSAGEAYCWGENGRGQLGVGDQVSHQAPTPVVGGVQFTAIDAGFWHVCGVTSDGTVFCWGDNTYGNLGTGDLISSNAPKRIVGTTARFRSVTAGSVHTCAISDVGSTFCWGSNFAGQLGDGTAQRRTTPTPAAAGYSFVRLRASRGNSFISHTCGVDTTGAVYCWGANEKSQLGNGPTEDGCLTLLGAVQARTCSYLPVRVVGLPKAAMVDLGQEHTCAITGDHQAYCWGENLHGELGDGSGVAQFVPVKVAGALRFP
jgi:alpha-tubulin suppressor-like RCC1 family protein